MTTGVSFPKRLCYTSFTTFLVSVLPFTYGRTPELRGESQDPGNLKGRRSKYFNSSLPVLDFNF